MEVGNQVFKSFFARISKQKSTQPFFEAFTVSQFALDSIDFVKATALLFIPYKS